jgi:hypothetical protein
LVVGHLGCFHSLAIVTNTAKTWVFKCLYCILTYTFSDTWLGVLLLGYMVVLFSFLTNFHTAFHGVILKENPLHNLFNWTFSDFYSPAFCFIMVFLVLGLNNKYFILQLLVPFSCTNLSLAKIPAKLDWPAPWLP